MRFKKLLSAMLLIVLILTTVPMSALAAFPTLSITTPMRVYTISTGNTTPVYESMSTSSKRIGTIYASDELYIYSMTGTWLRCTYPITGTNSRKDGYIPLSTITTNNMTHVTSTARERVTAYRRASTSTYGSYYYAEKGDTVIAVATSGSFVQVIYPLYYGGYRMAWVTLSDYNSHIKPITISPSTSSWQYPLNKARCSWRDGGSTWSWSQELNGNPNAKTRTFHLALDLTGSSSTVYPALDGTVAAFSSSTYGANGRYVIIKHNFEGKTLYSFYAHLSNVNVSYIGQPVTKSTTIGIQGGSGYGSNYYYGYAEKFTGNVKYYGGVIYYNPKYIVDNNKLP